MNVNKIYLSKKGYEEYLLEINNLKKQLQNNSRIKSRSYVGSGGYGNHNDFEFEEAKRQELTIIDSLERRVQNLEKVVIVEDTVYENLVNIGDVVYLRLIFGQNDIEDGL